MNWQVKEMIAGDYKIVYNPQIVNGTCTIRWLIFLWQNGWELFASVDSLKYAKNKVIQEYRLQEIARGIPSRNVRTPNFRWIIVEFTSDKSKIRMTDPMGNPVTRKIPIKRMWQITTKKTISHTLSLKEAKVLL